MNNNKSIEKLESELKSLLESADNIKKEIENMKSGSYKKIGYCPESADEEGFVINCFGRFTEDVFPNDEDWVSRNIIYRTREEAVHADKINVARLKVLRRIEELNEGWFPDWNC